MIDIAVIAVILSQTGIIWYLLKSQQDERSKAINAIIAKNQKELVELEAVDKIKPEKQAKKEDFVAVSDLTDDEFMDKIVKI